MFKELFFWILARFVSDPSRQEDIEMATFHVRDLDEPPKVTLVSAFVKIILDFVYGLCPRDYLRRLTIDSIRSRVSLMVSPAWFGPHLTSITRFGLDFTRPVPESAWETIKAMTKPTLFAIGAQFIELIGVNIVKECYPEDTANVIAECMASFLVDGLVTLAMFCDNSNSPAPRSDLLMLGSMLVGHASSGIVFESISHYIPTNVYLTWPVQIAFGAALLCLLYCVIKYTKHFVLHPSGDQVSSRSDRLNLHRYQAWSGMALFVVALLDQVLQKAGMETTATVYVVTANIVVNIICALVVDRRFTSRYGSIQMPTNTRDMLLVLLLHIIWVVFAISLARGIMMTYDQLRAIA